MKPLDLLQYIGKPYQKLDDNGKALGCMAPVYALYPDIPKYDWPEENFADCVLNLLKIHGKAIAKEDIQPGDVVAFKMPFGFLHMGIYVGNDWIIHCMTGETWERCRFGFVSRRLEGIFRWEGGA
jgi:uncharacterized protein YijF (DUF1287 family)